MAQGQSSATGTCRSAVAQAQAAGHAIPEWITLGTELVMAEDVGGPVITAGDVTDLGQDTPPAQEGPQEPGRLVRFDGVTPLRGSIPSDVPMLMSKYAFADAKAELQRGARLLARIDPNQHNGRLLVGVLVATRSDGSVVFLGDCVPKWTPAFAAYAAHNGLRPADLILSILMDPSGTTTATFMSSLEALTAAGP